MRIIKKLEGLDIKFGHAGTEGEALTTVQINIPIDGNEYIKGVNIIECIKKRILPVLNIDAFAQQLTEDELDLLQGLGETGILSTSTTDRSLWFGGANYLLLSDDASLGVVSFIPGNTKPTYTP